VDHDTTFSIYFQDLNGLRWITHEAVIMAGVVQVLEVDGEGGVVVHRSAIVDSQLLQPLCAFLKPTGWSGRRRGGAVGDRWPFFFPRRALRRGEVKRASMVSPAPTSPARDPTLHRLRPSTLRYTTRSSDVGNEQLHVIDVLDAKRHGYLERSDVFIL